MTPESILRQTIEHLEQERKWYVEQLVEIDFELANMHVRLSEVIREQAEAKDWTYTLSCHECGKPVAVDQITFDGGVAFCSSCIAQPPRPFP